MLNIVVGLCEGCKSSQSDNTFGVPFESLQIPAKNTTLVAAAKNETSVPIAVNNTSVIAASNETSLSAAVNDT